MKKICIVGLPNSGKRTLFSLLYLTIKDQQPVRILRGNVGVNRAIGALRQGRWPPKREEKEECPAMEVSVESLRRQAFTIQVIDLEDKIDSSMVASFFDATLIIFTIDSTADVEKQCEIYTNLFNFIDRRLREGTYRGVVVITKCSESGVKRPEEWLMENYPFLAGRGYPVYGVKIYTENSSPTWPVVADGVLDLVLEIFGDFRVKKGIETLNLDKITKEKLKKSMEELKSIIARVFKEYPEIKQKFEEKYNRCVKIDSLLNLLLTATSIYEEIPKNSIEKSSLRTAIINICDIVYGPTRMREYAVIKNSISAREIVVDKTKIVFELKAEKLVKGEARVVKLIIRNKHSFPVDIEIKSLTPKNASIDVRLEKMSVVGEAEQEMIITPTLAGDIILEFSGTVSAGKSTADFHKMFTLGAYEKMETQMAEQTIPPEVVKGTGGIPKAQVSAISPPPTPDVDIDKLLRSGSAKEWLELIEKCINEDKKIDLSKIDLGTLMQSIKPPSDKEQAKERPYEKGYKHLLTVPFMIDLNKYTPDDLTKISRIIKGVEITARSFELLLELKVKKELSVSPTMSDKSYIEDSLHILAGTSSLDSKEKRSMKEWKIKLEGGEITVKKEIIKDNEGKAKSIIYKIV